jgi:hypothetical protein
MKLSLIRALCTGNTAQLRKLTSGARVQLLAHLNGTVQVRA